MAHGAQEGERGAHPHALGVVHGDRPHPARIRVVHILVGRIPRIQARLHERLLEGQPRLARKPAYRNRALRAVKVVADVEVSFHLPEIGQNVHEAPAVVALGGPAVVVFGHAAQQHLSVDGAGAADHLAPWRGQHLGLLGGTLGPPRPVVGRALGRGIGFVSVFQVIGIVFVLWIIRSGFQQQNRSVRVLGQPGGHHAAARTGSNHNDVVLHPGTCRNSAEILINSMVETRQA